MTGGLRIAGAAMANFSARHDVISNNLANVSTPGFARQDTFVERLGELTAEPFRLPEVQTRTDFETPGPPILTGNHLDLSRDLQLVLGHGSQEMRDGGHGIGMLDAEKGPARL